MDDLTEYLNTAGDETMAASRIARYFYYGKLFGQTFLVIQ